MQPKLIRTILLATLLATPVAVHATDGHFLHGVGAINSAMGGAGVAAPTSLLGTYYLNPAGLMAFDGTRVEFGFELFKPSRTVESTFTPASMSGSTTSKSDFVPIPAMAFTVKLNNEKVVLGVGALSIGGFGVDYPSSTTNPILAPQPNGFGQVFYPIQFMPYFGHHIFTINKKRLVLQKIITQTMNIERTILDLPLRVKVVVKVDFCAATIYDFDTADFYDPVSLFGFQARGFSIKNNLSHVMF